MNVVQKEIEDNTATLQIEVEPDKVNDALDKAYQKVVQDVSIPGFRKGKVPRQVLEAKHGEEVLYKDALEILIPEAYEDAIEEADLEPISEPDIIDYEIEKDKPLVFEAKVDLKPEIDLDKYSGIEAEKEKVEISEDEINEYLKQKQEEHTQLENTDKQFVEENDYVIIDYEGKIDGESFPGGSEEEFGLEIGAEKFIPGFEEKLIGHKVGEEFEIEVTFPEDYQAPDLAGKTAIFDIEIKEIKEKVKPEINDDLAKEATEYETIEEYKDEIRKRIKEDKEARASNEFVRNILDKISENVDVEIPDEIINKELDLIYYETTQQFAGQDFSFEEVLEQSGMDREAWDQQNYPQAKKRALDKLILEAIIREEEIEISEEELQEEIKRLAEQYSQEPEDFRQRLEDSNQIDQFLNDLKRQKAIDFLKENNIEIEKTTENKEEELKTEGTEQKPESEELETIKNKVQVDEVEGDKD